MSKFFQKLAEAGWARKLVNSFAMPKDRKLQNRLDYERLFTLCRLNQALAAAAVKAAERQAAETLATSGAGAGLGPSSVMAAAATALRMQAPINKQRLMLEAKTTPYAEQQAAVDAHIRAQLVAAAAATHQALLQAGDPAPAASRIQAAAEADGDKRPKASSSSSSRKSSGASVSTSSADTLGSALRSSDSQADSSPVDAALDPSGQGLGRAELAQLLRQTLGFSLRVGPSAVNHPAAGLGLFLEGEVAPGTVVAVLPGVTYPCTQYSRMPNYPRIDINNPYLSRRFDMDIVDSKPWGQGLQAGATDPDSWVTPTCPEAQALSVLEGRHPLALGHYVNHPAAGAQPNVLEVGFSWEPASDDPSWMRAYIPSCPLVDLDDADEEEDDSESESTISERERQLRRWARAFVGKGPAAATRGLVFVSTRAIGDGEELLQNYRLNPRVPRPDWYHPVNAEEDERRWAQLQFLNVMASTRRKA